MKRVAFIAALVLGGVALMAARPGSEWQLVQQLNGQPVRWKLPDAGWSGVFSNTQVACMMLAGAKNVQNGTGLANTPTTVVPDVLLVTPLVSGNLCIRPSVFSTAWDGGCNGIVADENYGVPMAANVPQYITPDSKATHVCFYSDAGVVLTPIWMVK